MKSGPYFTILAGTRTTPCRGCQEPIYWVKNPKNPQGWIPVSIESSDPAVKAPAGLEDGVGISHHSNCPEAARYRKARVR